MTYYLLDLFSGAGGAAVGYHRAGFQVVGIDQHPQPRYPFGFCQMNALEALEWLLGATEIPVYRNGRLDEWLPLEIFDAIHASPPCQGYSVMSKCRPGLADRYPKLIEPVRELLIETGLPYVIENVPGAPLREPVQLCGTHFDLCATWKGQTFELQRHRWFETNWGLRGEPPCDHICPSLPVYGHGAPGNRPDLRGAPVAAMTRAAMEIDWMNRDELDEAIPPAFTRYVGRQLAAHLSTRRDRSAA